MNKKVKGLIIGIVALLIVVVIVYFFVIKKDNNIISNLINGINNKEEINDNYNGIYLKSVALDKSYYIFSQCAVDAINYYIVVVNDDYFSYRSTCMGTYYLENGNITELSFAYDDNLGTYNIIKDDETYYRNMQNRQIILNNDIADKFGKDYLRLENFNFMLKETEFAGNYYSLEGVPILGFPKEVRFYFIVDDNGGYDLSIIKKDTTFYVNGGYTLDSVPSFLNIGNGYAILEKNIVNGRYNYNLKMLNETGIIYNLNDKLPIVINGVRLTDDDNRLVVYDKENKYFRMFVSKNDKLCSDTNSGDNITYYEFKIKYNYNQQNMAEPEFMEFGYGRDGCSKINKYLEA